MNADQRKRFYILAIAPLVVSAGVTNCRAADITPPSERQPAKGVAEYADEFADAEQAQKPLIEWSMSFTRFIASGNGCRLSRLVWPSPRVRLDETDESLAMEPTAVESRIEKGFPTGESTPAPAPRDDSYHLAEKPFMFGGMTR